jgi:alpha-N-arabinofuranosidase
MVNVLQSVILTKEEKMVLTPTYHVFRMFRVHQEARLLKSDLKCEDYVFGDRGIPAVSGSASLDNEGKMHISLANLNPNKAIVLNCPIIGDTYKKVSGEVLTADAINAHNTFEAAEKVKPAAFSGHSYKNGVLTVTLPAKSVVVLELTK